MGRKVGYESTDTWITYRYLHLVVYTLKLNSNLDCRQVEQTFFHRSETHLKAWVWDLVHSPLPPKKPPSVKEVLQINNFHFKASWKMKFLKFLSPTGCSYVVSLLWMVRGFSPVEVSCAVPAGCKACTPSPDSSIQEHRWSHTDHFWRTAVITVMWEYTVNWPNPRSMRINSYSKVGSWKM